MPMPGTPRVDYVARFAATALDPVCAPLTFLRLRLHPPNLHLSIRRGITFREHYRDQFS